MNIIEYNPFDNGPYSEMDFTDEEKNFIIGLSKEFSIPTYEVEIWVLYIKNIKTILTPGASKDEINSILRYLSEKERDEPHTVLFKIGEKKKQWSIKIDSPELIRSLLKQVLKEHCLTVEPREPRDKKRLIVYEDNHPIKQATKNLFNRILPLVDISKNKKQPNETTTSVIICRLYAFYDLRYKTLPFSALNRKKCNDRIIDILKAK